MSTDLQRGRLAAIMAAEKIRASSAFSSNSPFSEIEWRDEMIRDLREALKFYADEENYQKSGWQGDQDKSLVDSDNGKVAREALEKR